MGEYGLMLSHRVHFRCWKATERSMLRYIAVRWISVRPYPKADAYTVVSRATGTAVPLLI